MYVDDEIQGLSLYNVLYGMYNEERIILERIKLVNSKRVSIKLEIQLRRY